MHSRRFLQSAIVALLLGVSLVSRQEAPPVQAEGGEVPEGCAAVGNLYPPFPFVAHQPRYDEASQALGRAATGALIDDERFFADLIETGRNGDRLVAPFLPARVLKALAYIESAWNQASLAVARGNSGPVLLSSSCAYGMTQVLSGMQHTKDDGTQPTALQRLTGASFRHNIARGVQELVEKWNYTPYRTSEIAFPQVGDRLPQFAESWYFAIWAYHGMSTRNTPANPDMPWPRPRYNSPEYNHSSGCKGYGCYPYQELVYDLAMFPPVVFGVRLWPSFASTLPDRDLFVGAGGGAVWPAPDIELPRPAHQDRLREGSPRLEVDQSSIALNLLPHSRVPEATVRVDNAGTGPMGWRATLTLIDRPNGGWVSAHQSTSIDDGRVAVIFRPDALEPGTYRAIIRIDAPLSPGSPVEIPVVLTITENRSFVPGLSRN